MLLFLLQISTNTILQTGIANSYVGGTNVVVKVHHLTKNNICHVTSTKQQADVIFDGFAFWIAK